MSDIIKCRLFGSPEIRLNGELVLFSFSKIDALIYYLLITKSTSRDEVAGLFWPDKNEQNAKKNLRNAIYQGNKLLGMELIKSPNKALLVLNDEIEIDFDVETFMAAPKDHLPLYTDSFLKGFFLKECESFEFWVIKMRSFYEKIFLQECFKKIESDIEVGCFESVEKNIQRLIHIDEFDESNYQLLMRFYQMTQRDEKAVEIYYELSNLLKMELGITPNRQSKDIYNISLEKLNEEQNKDKQRFNDLFYGRFDELKKIEGMISGFKNNQTYQSLLISGEAGVGKSALTNVVLDNIYDEFTLIETQCYQVEEKYDFRPWKKIINELSHLVKEEKWVDLNTWQEVMTLFFPNLEDHLQKNKGFNRGDDFPLNRLMEVITETLNLLSETKKIILVFEDIQWMDQLSLDLLSSVMLNVSSNCMFILTARNEKKQALEQFTNSLIQCGLLGAIDLHPFTFMETEVFIQKKLSNQSITSQSINNVFEYTEGNLFFLIEYISLLQTNANLNTMTVKMKDALKNRFLYLTEEEQTLVNLVSYFYDYALFSDLANILEIDDATLVDLLESLVGKNILKEVNIDGEIGAAFTHVKLREFIYMNQSVGKKRLYHNQIADYLEANLDSYHLDYLLYDSIAYHYKKGRQELKSLTYKLLYLEKHLGFYHELFPVEVKREGTHRDSLSFNQENVLKDFSSIHHMLEQLENKYSTDLCYQELYCQYLYLEGRFFIKYGKYEKGVKNIEEVIRLSKEGNNSVYLLSGYKQMIYYYIQIDEPKKMSNYIELALDLSIKENNHQSIGVLLRLKGLYAMMSGNSEQAEKLLKESINTFMLTDAIAKKYAINIAAAYNYLGEIRFNEARFEEAVLYFNKAIDLCHHKQSLSSLSVFYTNAGAALYAQGKFDLAEDYLLSSLAIYKEVNTFWKRPRLDAYLSLVYMEKADKEKVRHFLDKGQDFTENMKNDRDIGIVAFAKALVAKGIGSEVEETDFWKETIVMSGEKYAEIALKHLNANQDFFEIECLKQVFQ